MFKTFTTYLFVFACCSVWASAPGSPGNPRIIDSFSQLGVDSPTPRFGWIVNDPDRNERQSAYQIIVATNETDIDANLGSAWDTGKVATNLQYGITYSSLPLSPASKYWFKVRTWDKDNQVSAWSAKTNFVTGFFQPGDWASGIQWIKHPLATTGKTNANPPAMFRKEFQITKPVKQAHLFICGLGQFVASLNGAKIGNNEMDPAWTDYDVTANYVTFDVTSQLEPGANVLGVMLGHGWYGYPGSDTRNFGPLKLWAQLRVDFTDGTSSNIVTDTSWKAATSPWTYTEVHGAETYDARLDQAGWNVAGYNDAAWSNAVVAPGSASLLAAQNAPPIRTRQIYLPARITNPAANVYLYDFGQVINGQYEITVSGTNGMVVTLLTAEYLKSNGRVPAPGNNSNRTGYSTYTLKGGGPETWRLTFTATGFHYLEISGVTTNGAITSLPLVQVVKAFHLCTAARDVGSFSASDDRYEQIYKQALITMQNCLQSVHVDGPNFERLGWQEVVWTTLPSIAYHNDVQTLWTKLMRDVREAQRVSGLCPDIAPNWFHRTNDAPRGKYDDAPAWGSSIFIASWFIYQNYGDKKVLADNYVTMTNYLAYLKTKERGGRITYGLGDWMAPGGTPVGNVEGAVYVYDTGLMRDVATVLGQTTDATFYANEYTRVRDAYNEAFFDTNSQSYSPMNQANQAIPLAFGIVPTNSIAAVQLALVSDIAAPRENGLPTSYGKVGEYGPILPYHVTAGDIGVTPLWRALGDAGQPDLVQTMIMQPTSPSYLAMLNAGETCITENWNLAKARSHSHDMYAGIFEWLYRTLGGISSTKPGYEEIQLKPGMPAGLTNLSCSYQSVRGNISSAWNINGNQVVTWNIQIPANTTAKVFIPVPGTSTNHLTITESGTLIWTNNSAVGSVTGLTFDHLDTGAVVWRAGSGNYQFSWRIAPTPAGSSATSGTTKISPSFTNTGLSNGTL
jgi:alpha-L-rhamnosidase